MGARFEYIVSLRARHPTMAVGEMAAAVGLIPDTGWTVGDQRQTPTRRPLEGLRAEGYCAERIGHGEDGQLARCLETKLAEMKSREAELHAFRSAGGSIAFFVSWHPHGDSGENFAPDLLLELGRLGIGLELNVLRG